MRRLWRPRRPPDPQIGAPQSPHLDAVLACAALPALLLIPPIYVLVRTGYPWWRAESYLLVAGPLSVAASVLLLRRRLPRLWRLSTLAAFAYVLLYFLMLEGGAPVHQPAWKLASAIPVYILAALLIVRLKTKGLTILGAAATAFLLSIIFASSPRIPAVKVTGDLPPGNKSLPPIIHIVLDEHTGVAQVPPHTVPAMARALASFRVYPDSYSTFSYTPFSMFTALNPDYSPDASWAVSYDKRDNSWRLPKNQWIDALKQKGYVVSVHQPRFIDYCSMATSIDRCYIYNSSNLSILDSLELGALTKWLYLLRKTIPHAINRQARSLGAAASFSAIEDVMTQLRTGSRGRLFFVHLMIPHAPFLYDASCRLKNPLGWTRYELTRRRKKDEFLHLYFDQMNCAWLQIERLLTMLDGLSEAADALILIHGDHGARFFGAVGFDTPGDLAQFNRVPGLSEEFAVDQFATLLALRAPDIDRDSREGRISVQQTIASLLGNCDQQENQVPTGYVLMDHARIFVERPNPGLIPFALPPLDSAPASLPCSSFTQTQLTSPQVK